MQQTTTFTYKKAPTFRSSSFHFERADGSSQVREVVPPEEIAKEIVEQLQVILNEGRLQGTVRITITAGN